MAATTDLEITLEAQGSLPNFRYDLVQPLVHGRVAIEGVSLQIAGPMTSAGYFTNPKFPSGDFGLLDTNWGDVVPAIDAGWDLVCLPIFIKRKPVYNYLWVRADRGIDSPKDLEGKLIGTGGYQSAITIYTRGLLQHHFGVDLSTLRWLSSGPKRWDLHDSRIQIEYTPGKSPVQRLLDGEVDASTGDITDTASWAALEGNPLVKRLFPDYQTRNQALFTEHGIHTPVHIILMSGKLHRAHPDLARRVYDAFVRSLEMAYDDALGDGSGFSMTLHNREAMRDQLATWGDAWRHGVSANQQTITTFLDYCAEQGLTRTRLPLDRVFAAGTLDT